LYTQTDDSGTLRPVANEPLAQRLARIARVKTTTITHHGRKSGKPYQVTIWFTVDGDHINLYTMSMKRQWPQNVQVNPKISLRIGNEQFTGAVTPITDANEMKHVVKLMRRKYPVSIPYLWFKKRPDGAFHVRLDGAS
jgi:deazaflavin-dependent oxidoreductase (nitroreductase family)